MIEPVEAAERGDRFANRALGGFGFRGIAGKGERLSAEHDLRARDAIGIAADDDDMRARRDASARRREAEARGAADDDESPAGEGVMHGRSVAQAARPWEAGGRRKCSVLSRNDAVEVSHG